MLSLFDKKVQWAPVNTTEKTTPNNCAEIRYICISSSFSLQQYKSVAAVFFLSHCTAIYVNDVSETD